MLDLFKAAYSQEEYPLFEIIIIQILNCQRFFKAVLTLSTNEDITKIDTTVNSSFEWDIPYSEITVGESVGFGGSYGKLYKASWKGFQVALRVCGDFISQETTENVKKEIRLLTRLRHPNLVSILSHTNANKFLQALYLGVCTVMPHICIVNEYVNRVSELKTNQLSNKTLLHILYQCSLVLNYLHSQHPPIIVK
jgi:serine/threonine protein kinase